MKRATFGLGMGLVVVTGGGPGAGRWMKTTSAAPAKASPANALIDITVNEGTSMSPSRARTGREGQGAVPERAAGSVRSG